MRKQKGFSLIELLIVVAIILIIAAIAIPNLLRARMSANDAAAASSMRTINTAEVTFVTTYATAGYAPDLKTLGPNSLACGSTGVAPTATSACLLDDQLGCTTAQPCIKGGYKYFLTSSSATAPVPDYTASATPIAVSTTGTRNFCTNADAVVRATPASPAPTQLAAAMDLATCAGLSALNQ